jgi:8-oxo-dGTP pyrophosphatase MutT (NUDIX family)
MIEAYLSVGESIDRAAIREAKEETGLDVRPEGYRHHFPDVVWGTQ